uniref:Protein kinase domain-containing protein n=1 Tax=Caenorhabditis tropicalis TaxID=1561998 RepID=A0A1I7TDY3_9PELO
MGFKLVALSSWLLTVSSLSIEHNAVGGGCVDLLCPDTASHHGLRNLVNEDTLKTDSCTACSQCTENGFSVCLRPKDSRASRTTGGCSCAHTLAANCHTDLTQTQHPANLTMKVYTTCYSDALQRPPEPLAVNENSSVIVRIEPFWLEPYWRHLKIENVTLHYKFQVKAPEHCEGEVESTPNGVHTCVASVLVDLSESKEDQPKGSTDDDDYDHSDNYDQYDDDLPPEVQFDRDVFSGAKELESYYTSTIHRSRQIKASASKDQQIYDIETIMESEHLKFDLKPELYGNEESESVDEPSNDSIPSAVEEEESATVVQENKDEGDVSEETGGTNFFEEEEKNEEEKKKKEDESEEEDGVLKVNLEDIEPTKLKSQEDAKKKIEEEGDDEEEKEEGTTEKNEEKSEEDEEKKDDEEKKENDKESDNEEKKDEEEEEETTEEGTTVADEEDSEDSNEEDSDETTTVELVEGETDPSQQNFLERFYNSSDYIRVRNVFVVCLIVFILFCGVALCCLYGNKCCKSKESKTSNGYRYTSANPPPTELVSREKEHLRQ